MKYLSFFLVVVASFKVHGQQTSTIHGTVKASDTGRPITGASIVAVGTDMYAITDDKGSFSLSTGKTKGIIRITHIGYNTTDETFDLTTDRKYIIAIEPQSNIVDEVQVIGYGQTSRRYNTGSVSTINAKEIEQQPVTNVLSALSGRMPGVFVQTSNGLPGGNINIQVRGKGSIAAGTNPLYIIDGVQFDGQAIGQGQAISRQSVTGVLSPLNLVNPGDIESITVLKDADATSIYGSRGSNGVILITTKKGKEGSTNFSFGLQTGINQAAGIPKLLNLADYLQIRNEAFENDGLVPSDDPNSPQYAPDLTVWSNTSSTDWAEYLLGGNGNTTNAQASLRGGSARTSFTSGFNYHRESNILPGDNSYQRGGGNINLVHKAFNEKLSLTISNSVILDGNDHSNIGNNLGTALILPPNYPLFDESGALNWRTLNPFGLSQARSKIKSNNLRSNAIISYELMPKFELKANVGYNRIYNKQVHTFPTQSVSPGRPNASNFGEFSNESILIEPQLTFSDYFGNSGIDLLVGGSYQSATSNSQYIRGQNFVSDGLLENIGSAGVITDRSNSSIQYKFVSFFGRATYTFKKRYIANATIRRDGSSRFGPGNQFGNFGSLGLAWLFSEENWVRNVLPFVSYGKLRLSAGVTGNDQIPDYQYLSAYSTSPWVYNGLIGMAPTRISNDNYKWETTDKYEVAVEVGIFKDRLLLNVNRFMNYSRDQLVQYPIPAITGFPNYQANIPVVIENSGWEFDLFTENVKNGSFQWQTNFNLTLPKNVLKKFDGIASSSYAQTLKVGYDITRVTGYQFLGLDDEGRPLYADQAGNPSTSPYFFRTLGKVTPDFYGGLGNSFSYKNISLEVFFQFVKNRTRGGIGYTPGFSNLNNYQFIIDRWTGNNSSTDIPKASTMYDAYYAYSTANFFDSSYIRLKNVSVSYALPKTLLKNLNASIFLQGQNLFAIWDKSAPLLDPESGGNSWIQSGSIPPLKSFVLGFKIDI